MVHRFGAKTAVGEGSGIRPIWRRSGGGAPGADAVGVRSLALTCLRGTPKVADFAKARRTGPEWSPNSNVHIPKRADKYITGSAKADRSLGREGNRHLKLRSVISSSAAAVLLVLSFRQVLSDVVSNARTGGWYKRRVVNFRLGER